MILRVSCIISQPHSTCRLIYTIYQSVKLTSDLIIILYNKTSLNITKQSFCLWTVVDRQRGLYESQVNFFGQIQGRARNCDRYGRQCECNF